MLLLEDSGTVVRLSSVAKPKRAVPERREVGRTARCSTPCHEPISRIHRSVGLAWAYNMGRKHNVHHCVPHRPEPLLPPVGELQPLSFATRWQTGQVYTWWHHSPAPHIVVDNIPEPRVVRVKAPSHQTSSHYVLENVAKTGSNGVRTE